MLEPLSVGPYPERGPEHALPHLLSALEGAGCVSVDPPLQELMDEAHNYWSDAQVISLVLSDPARVKAAGRMLFYLWLHDTRRASDFGNRVAFFALDDNRTVMVYRPADSGFVLEASAAKTVRSRMEPFVDLSRDIANRGEGQIDTLQEAMICFLQFNANIKGVPFDRQRLPSTTGERGLFQSDLHQAMQGLINEDAAKASALGGYAFVLPLTRGTVSLLVPEEINEPLVPTPQGGGELKGLLKQSRQQVDEAKAMLESLMEDIVSSEEGVSDRVEGDGFPSRLGAVSDRLARVSERLGLERPSRSEAEALFNAWVAIWVAGHLDGVRGMFANRRASSTKGAAPEMDAVAWTDTRSILVETTRRFESHDHWRRKLYTALSMDLLLPNRRLDFVYQCCGPDQPDTSGFQSAVYDEYAQTRGHASQTSIKLTVAHPDTGECIHPADVPGFDIGGNLLTKCFDDLCEKLRSVAAGAW